LYLAAGRCAADYCQLSPSAGHGAARQPQRARLDHSRLQMQEAGIMVHLHGCRSMLPIRDGGPALDKVKYSAPAAMAACQSARLSAFSSACRSRAAEAKPWRYSGTSLRNARSVPSSLPCCSHASSACRCSSAACSAPAAHQCCGYRQHAWLTAAGAAMYSGSKQGTHVLPAACILLAIVNAAKLDAACACHCCC
jgi:hypothetical protein